MTINIDLHDFAQYRCDMKLEPSLSRRDVIARRLVAGNSVLATTLAAEFEVSEDAIRRDLRALAAEGLCRRVYGGALPASRERKPLTSRLTENLEAKSNLARAAAETIQPGELVFLDCGSTNIQIVEHLPVDKDITVATNSPDVAQLMTHNQQIPVLIIGGMVDYSVGGCVDASTISSLKEIAIDRSFVGCCSISADSGIRARVFAEAQFKKVLLANSRSRIMLATSDKFRDVAPFRIGGPTDIDALFVNSTISEEDEAALNASGYRLIRVP